MVLVAGLDRLEGTRVGPWLSDAEWQDHTREVRERFEARSDTSVAFQDFCRAYAEGRVTTAAMRRARAPKSRDTAPLFTNLSVDAGQGDYLLREHCSSVGEVASVELLMRGYNGTVPTGSAIVQYYSAAAATAAIQDLNGTELDGRRLYVRAYFT